MYNYCTLFDSNYLHKGLALYKSLSLVCEKFHLYVVAFDDNCFNKLKELGLANLTVISLLEFETQELLAVKPTRNRAEYCWTCGPTVIYYCIQNYKLNHCTYLDADLMFFSSPEPIYCEIGQNSIGITEHFTKKTDNLGGRFCVQFVYFKNDVAGMEALIWWKDKCIEWCFARFEDGKYGDQKYLDSFPLLFKKVHIVENRGCGVAPWNINLYTFPKLGTLIYKNQLFSIIFFHFHGTKIDLIGDELVLKSITMDIAKDAESFVYYPYLEQLKEVYNEYLGENIQELTVLKRRLWRRLYSAIKKIFRNNSFFQYLYFKVIKVTYNGYEDKDCDL